MFTHFSQPRRPRPTSRPIRIYRPRTAAFRPHLEILEDRTVLSTIAYQVPAGTVGVQSFSGPLGMDFDTTRDVVITRLGVFDSGADGLARPLTARLYNRDTGTQLASLAFAAGNTGSLVDSSRFLPLATPVVLPTGFHGSIVAEGYGPDELNGNAGFQTLTWTTDGGGSLSFVGGGRFGSTAGVFPASPDAGPANRYAAGTFEFLPLADIATGPANALAGNSYTLNLNLAQASNITQWTIDWGDGHTENVPGNPAQASHVYAVSGNFTITATAYDSTLGALGSSQHAVVLAGGPAAYWRLDETTPTTAFDEVSGQNGTYVNLTAAQLGQPGALENDSSPSVSFDGVNDYVSLPDVFGFPPTGSTASFTVSFSAWFKTTSFGVILGQTDLSGVPGGAAPQGWVPGVYVGIDGRVYASLFWHGSVPILASPGFYNDGQWHQVVAVYEAGSETLYLDGLRVAGQTAATVPYASGYRYFLGVGYTPGWPNTVGPWLFFHGNLDEAAVYHGALSAQQVAAQFAAARVSRPTVVVEDPPPMAFVQGPATGVSGEALTFTFSASSTSATLQAAGFTYSVNWGDGNSQVIGASAGNGSGVALSRAFAQDGTYQISVTATDAAGHTSTQPGTATVVIATAAPTAFVQGPATGVLGEALTFTFSASSPSPTFQVAGFSYLVSWGDGSSEAVTASAGNGTGVTLSHAFAQDGTYQVTVTATDAAGQTGAPSTPLAVVIETPPPTAFVQGPGTGVLGESLTFTFSASSPSSTLQAAGFTYTVNWGDGNSEVVDASAGNGSGVTRTHAFAQDGTYQVTVTATDSAGHTGAPSSPAAVEIATPAPTAFVLGPAAGLLGQSLPFTFSASSPSPTFQVAGFRYVISWGDGNSEVIERSSGNGSGASRSHVFTQSGNFTVTVTATDTAGHTSAAASWTTVITSGTSPAPMAFVQGPTAAVRGQPLLFTFLASSSSPALQAAGFRYVISWGDGNSEVVERSSGNGAGVTLSHIFTQSGSFTVTVTATDADGHTSAAASLPVAVTPWAIQTQPDPLNPGQTIQVLVVGGSTGADVIVITPGTMSTGIKLQIKEKDFNRVLEGTFTERIDRIVVYGQAGDDSITVAEGIKVPSELYGGDGDDTLSGGAGADLLVGGAGADLLRGRLGRNLLIGGQGSDQLFGGGAESLLIGGRTVFDANAVALRALLAEWASGDDYLQRIGHLLGTRAGGRNGAYRLTVDTMLADGVGDVLHGYGGRDWFVVHVGDQITDRESGEVVTAF